MYYGNLFLIFSMFGYFYEMLIRLIRNIPGHTLFIGPWMPIYGFGVLMVEFIDRFLSLFQIRGRKKIFLNFFLSTILLTILELIGGLFVEILFKTSFWNYEQIPLHIGKYINVFVSLLWGIGSLLIVYIINPALTPFIKKIPKWVSILCFLLMTLDHVYLLIRLLLQ